MLLSHYVIKYGDYYDEQYKLVLIFNRSSDIIHCSFVRWNGVISRLLFSL